VKRWIGAIVALLCLTIDCSAASQTDAEAAKGKELLKSNCGRCHGVVPGNESPLKQAPNLAIVLGNWPYERLEVELSEGVGSRHPEMPQIQFSPEDIISIYDYLHGHSSETPPPKQ
jgi:cytochrome c